MTGRSVPEWVGKTPDSPIPARVKVRVFQAHKGICHIAGRKILAGELWDAEHVIALCNWLPTDDQPHGNRESNLAPALRSKHREKTAHDVAEKSLVARKRSKHLGVKPKGRGFPKPPPGYNPWTRRIET